MLNKFLAAITLFTTGMVTPVIAGNTALSVDQLVTLTSQYDYSTTVKKLKTAFASKGLTVFATINHSEEAKAAGLTMPPTQVIIFGNPKDGTPLMQKAPALALQLPLKVLIAEDNDGTVKVRFFKAAFLAASVGENVELTAGLSKVEKLITKEVTQ